MRNFGLTGPDGNISAAADNRLTGVVGHRNDGDVGDQVDVKDRSSPSPETRALNNPLYLTQREPIIDGLRDAGPPETSVPPFIARAYYV